MKYTILRVAQTEITEISSAQPLDKLLIFIPGGAFVSGPSAQHWQAAEKLAKATNYKVWLCNYPKAPEHQITEISGNMDAVYSLALSRYLAQDIVVLGDSAGGTLALALCSRCGKQKMALPAKLIVISPLMDASFENPEIDLVEKRDLILSKTGLLSATKMCAGNVDLKNEQL